MSLLSLAIMIWGVQTGLWFLAIPMILVFEGRRLIKRRWSLSLNNLKSLLALCGGMIGLLLLLLFIAQPSFAFIYRFLQWLPL
jgi:protein-glutamine gamma-glutamyltransferase